MVEQCVVVLGSQQAAWEHDGMEWDIVLGHELVELDIVRVLPPFLPLLCVAGSDGEVAGRTEIM